ncbi:MAG: hypothetical protein HPY66_3348 [Firmicutes bacterium]|nr:hypothetical protein [Bacillota bacterium]MDI6706784.1 LysO family transporter [Bacillota bacterium]
MWLYILFLTAGIAVGLYNSAPAWLEKYSGVFQLWGLIIILFAMGVAIGSDKDVINSFMRIGVHSVVFALAAITGSVAAVRVFRPAIQRQRERAS